MPDTDNMLTQITANPSLGDPRKVLPKFTALLDELVANKQQIGAQLFASIKGEPVADFGHGRARLDMPMTPENLMIWFSSTKPFTSVAIAQLWERGKLELDDKVSKYIPEFAQGGKDPITIRNVLTHTGGFRWADGRPPQSKAFITPWEPMIKMICESPLEEGWIPKKKAGYHPTSGWFILGEIVRRIDGRGLGQYVREEIFLPIGMNDSFIGMPSEVFKAYEDRLGYMCNTAEGEIRVLGGEGKEWGTALCIPGAGGRGPMRDLAKLYEALYYRGALNGNRILLPQTVEAITARHRVGMYDNTFMATLDWGLGFIPCYSGYGGYASWRSFGHGGAQSSVGFCDPSHGLAVGLVNNGMCGRAAHGPRAHRLITTLYEDLGLFSPGQQARALVQTEGGWI